MEKTLLKKLQIGLISLSTLALLAACGTTDDLEDPALDEDPAVEEPADEGDDVVEEEATDDAEDIVAVAQGNPDFSILVSALQEAGLVETLQGEGPFTVFAPTDAAFDKLLDDLGISAEELLAQEDLEKVLTNHVVSGKVMADDLSDGQVAESLNSEELTFDLSEDPTVNGARIVMTDVEASNGIIHAIDNVLVPSNFELQEVDAE